MAFDFSPEALDREFPVRRQLVYFNHAAVAPLPRRVSDAIVAHTENTRDRGAADWRRWYGGIEAAREKAARLIGADNSAVAFLPSTSWGLNLVAQAFPWRAGDNVVGDDMEFPSNVYPWMLLAGRGVEHRRAKSRGGRIDVEDIEAMIDSRTRVVAISWVAFHNGWVYPVREIGALCRQKGILLVLDAIQGLGALPLDVREVPVDVVVADAHKWMLGPEGCALFFVSESARERVPPPFGGWWNVRSDQSYLQYELNFFSGARRFEPGSLPTAQVMGLSAALDLIAEMGPETVQKRIRELIAALASGLEGLGWEIASPQPLRSGILAAIPPGGDARSAAKSLEQAGVSVSPREGAVRFSPHAGNDTGEVERVLSLLRSSA